MNLSPKIEEGSPLWQLAKDWKEAYPDQEPQIGFGLGKAYAVTTLEDYINTFGNICKIRFSKRRGYRGVVQKDGRKIRWW